MRLIPGYIQLHDIFPSYVNALFPRATSQVAACSGVFDFECLFQIFPITMDNSSSIEHNSLKHRNGTEIHHMMQIGCQIFFTSQLQITTMIPEEAGIEVWLAKFVSVLHPQT